MGRIADVLREKGTTVQTTTPSASVYEAIEKMVAHNFGSLVVMDGSALCGMFTERDYLRRVVLEGRTSRTTSVAEIMSTEIAYVAPEHGVEEALAVMTAERCRHLPVLRDGDLVGLVSIGDLVKHLIRDQEAEILHLNDYICGKYPR
ncbi:MAG: CBS domain-containing protein [Acidobacteria bacterium]|nr:CBS domain-containing protein [Acidobacteriota bacterium]